MFLLVSSVPLSYDTLLSWHLFEPSAVQVRNPCFNESPFHGLRSESQSLYFFMAGLAKVKWLSMVTPQKKKKNNNLLNLCRSLRDVGQREREEWVRPLCVTELI